jgi:uncharacterized protein YbbC (DUF1343 family)
MSGPVATGLDRIASDEHRLVRGKRVALLAHPASVDRHLRPAADVLAEAGARIVVLLGPEHGFGGEAQDMEGVRHRTAADAPRVFSLYGDSEASLHPTREMLDGVDLLVVDLQDIGTRYYTFVWTAAFCLDACAEAGIEALVLDRPDPLGCDRVEGPGIQPGYLSFVGLHDVPVRHGLTIAEVLRLYARERRLDLSLEVLAMAGYRRSMSFGDTGLPWVMTSPNMPTLDTALVYPGMCLIEGTDVSEGRGTTRPFEIVGAPWVDGRELARSALRSGLPGCTLRPLSFRPTFHKHAGRSCGGVQVHVTDARAFLPLRTGVALLQALWYTPGNRLSWRREPYEFVSDRPAIDLLAGGAWLRDGIESDAPLDDLCGWWARDERSFRERSEPAWLYR